MKRRHLVAIAFMTGLILMVVRRQPSQAPTKAEPKSKVLDVMPIKLGDKRLAFQLNMFLPQVHLTLISVLQGVALGVLIAQFGIVSPFSFPAMLLYIDSVIGIALIWYLYANAFLTFLWPFSAMHILLQFLLAAFESLALAFISRPAIWTLGVAVAAFVGAVIRWLNTKLVTPGSYERRDMFEFDMELERSGSMGLVLLAAISLILGLILLIVDWQQCRYLEHLTAAVGMVLGIILIWMLREADRAGMMLIQKHLEGSPWIFERQQLVERETE